jgi:type II secretory ATPase GspE/PulE/Tfp pilus assembly ATPase PilB-like protein
MATLEQMDQTDEPLVPDASATERWVDKELRSALVLCTDGTLLVAEGHRHNPVVDSAIQHIHEFWPGYRREINMALEKMLQLQRPAERQKDAESSTIESVRDLIAQAARQHASDIHIRVYEQRGYGDIRMRADGRCGQVRGKNLRAAELFEQCAVIGGVMPDIGNGHYNPAIPQSARIGAETGHLPASLQNVRVQSSPMLGGTYMVLRLQYHEKLLRGALRDRLAGLGYEPSQSAVIEELSEHTDGIVFVTGPTGSGKSTSLFVIVSSIIEANSDINFITVEDPPEYLIHGAEQLPVLAGDSAADRQQAFASAIRNMLRLDPDRAMVGEIRDAESAELAAQASATGHQVWTTLHANSAWKTLQRLSQMCEKKPETRALIHDADTVRGLMAQRLVGKLCPHCAVPLAGNEGQIAGSLLQRLKAAMPDLSGVKLRGDGCPHCSEKGRFRGSRGRTVVAEVVETTTDLMDIAHTQGVAAAEKAWLAGGGLSMMGHGLGKLARGEVDPRELQRAVGPIKAPAAGERKAAMTPLDVERGVRACS